MLAAHPDIQVVVHPLDVNDHDQVFTVFAQAAADLGGLDRVIVNAGLGKGGRIGTGKFFANKETAETNFIAALAQCEAAMEHFYERKAGHLVVISSMSAMRGMPSSMTTYAASKAAVAALAEGIRSDLIGRKGVDIKVTTLFPGYIASEMSGKVEQGSSSWSTPRRGVVPWSRRSSARSPTPPSPPGRGHRWRPS
ncbi:SDR family NAD(P)-dependent oxidoreductase [Aeromicrobium sp. UC242_57]|uniref:SDR family NAD(P)-dependent oxidoreductase n=1 Tax=Aeromicrobium sp. UC242_57 TaxID=3374624 RepID=UPI0037968E3A